MRILGNIHYFSLLFHLCVYRVWYFHNSVSFFFLLIFTGDIVCNLEFRLEFCFHHTILEVLFTLLILISWLNSKVFILVSFLNSPSSPLAWRELQLLEISTILFNSPFNCDLIAHSKYKAVLAYNISRSVNFLPVRTYVSKSVISHGYQPDWYSESN